MLVLDRSCIFGFAYTLLFFRIKWIIKAGLKFQIPNWEFSLTEHVINKTNGLTWHSISIENVSKISIRIRHFFSELDYTSENRVEAS